MRSDFCPRQQTPPPKPSRSMWRAICTLLPIALALILLPVIAFASPPDPSWIAGIYDGADGDDIVSLVYETSATNVTVPPHVGPLLCVEEMSLEGIERSVPGSRLTLGPRSPPTIASSHGFNSAPDYTPSTSPFLTPLAAQPSPRTHCPGQGDFREVSTAVYDLVVVATAEPSTPSRKGAYGSWKYADGNTDLKPD